MQTLPSRSPHRESRSEVITPLTITGETHERVRTLIGIAVRDALAGRRVAYATNTPANLTYRELQTAVGLNDATIRRSGRDISADIGILGGRIRFIGITGDSHRGLTVDTLIIDGADNTDAHLLTSLHCCLMTTRNPRLVYGTAT